MHILCPVEAWWPTWPNTVCAEGLDGFLFQSLVGNEIVVVVRGQIGDSATIGKLGLGARRTARMDDKQLAKPTCMHIMRSLLKDIPDYDRPFFIFRFLKRGL